MVGRGYTAKEMLEAKRHKEVYYREYGDNWPSMMKKTVRDLEKSCSSHCYLWLGMNTAKGSDDKT